MGCRLHIYFGPRQEEGVTNDLIAAENLSIFNEPVLAALEGLTKSRADPDWGVVNEGVTKLRLK